MRLRESVCLPTIFQAQCDHCSFVSDVFPAEYGAIYLDEPQPAGENTLVAGIAFFEGAKGKVAIQGDRRLVVLAHPIEDAILAETGLTWESLVWAGRYVRIRRVVCKSCGTLFEIHRLACPPGLGCMVGSFVGLPVGVAFGLWERSFCFGFWVAYGIAFGFCCAANLAGWVYIRLRFKGRAKAIDGPPCCPNCHSTGWASVERRRTFPCPQCGQKAMRVRSVGKS